MDKAYDSEKLHRYFASQNIWSIAPVKKNWRKGQLRKKLKNNFPTKIYHKRNMVESVFHAFKQKFGSSVSSKKIGPARTEIYCKTILHNLFLRIIQVLGHTRNFNQFFIEFFMLSFLYYLNDLKLLNFIKGIIFFLLKW